MHTLEHVTTLGVQSIIVEATVLRCFCEEIVIGSPSASVFPGQSTNSQRAVAGQAPGILRDSGLEKRKQSGQ